jgi:hypothetical protein
MLELFVIGGIGFWGIIVAELVLLFLFSEAENGVGATISLIAFGFMLQWFSKVNLLALIYANPALVAVVGVAYALFGIVWLIYKWRMLIGKYAKIYDEQFTDFLKDKKLPLTTEVLPVEYRKEWSYIVEKSKDYHTGRTIADAPLASKHISQMLRWWSLWPISLCLYLFRDLVKDAFTVIYNRLAKFLQRMSDDMFGKRKIKENLDLSETNQ